MQEHLNDPASRDGRLDQTVERLTSEVTALKLELATLISAVNELQVHQLGRRLPARPREVPPPPKTSSAPAAVIVLIAVGLLSWQLIMAPRTEGRVAARPVAAAHYPLARRAPVIVPAIATTAEPERPVLARPTIYRGTLSVAADQPQAEVFVDRKRVGTAPVRLKNLRAGSHLVWIESEGHRRWTRVVTVPAAKVTRVKADLEPVDPADALQDH